MAGGARGVVGVEQHLDGAFAKKLAGDGSGDLVAGHVSQILIHQKRRIRIALTNEVTVKPSFGDAFELTEEM